jgi:Bacterial protein of unknown function (DUF882)
MRHSAIWAALLGMVAVTAAPRGEARATHEKSTVSHATRAHGTRISAKGPVEPSRHTRRRSGSTPVDRDKPLSGEVVGGVGPKDGKAHAKGTRAAPAHVRTAGAARHRVARVLPAVPKPPCFHDPIEFERGFGGDVQSVVLTRCDGRPAPHAVEQISVLVRPMNAPKPSVDTTPIRHGGSQREWLPGVKLVNEGLVARLQRVVDHFQVKKITVVSGYRPSSLGSFHQSARAIDFHLSGVTNEALVVFCRTLNDTGCGYYPNSSFVHMDVRTAGTGHVYWIDSSGPGEPARYVANWPPKDGATLATEIPRPDPAAPLDEQTHPDSQPQLPPGASDTKVDARTTAPLSAGDGKDDPFAP